jgi:hypothetical protein
VSTICFAGSNSTPGFDLRLTAMQTITVDEVTLQLLDGSNVGGPSVTVPQPGLASQLGSPTIPAGATRLVTLTPQPPCGPGPLQPHAVSARIGFTDGRGTGRTLTVHAPLL